ncbi:NAD(P)-dependent oxidoreductase [Alsobacter sp. KACC 23698]|uniref:NAD(P)-dependent oxidoreductase n=1 Tax=Alsobacter sp. KACC 23698 TaxID=3149229 RepID=A0AAU7JDF5_9HYPH
MTPFAAPDEAVRDAGVLVTMLKDGPADREAFVAASSNLRHDAVWFQLGTVGAGAADALATLARERGVAFYDAPVQGTRQPAEQGKLVVLASGAPDRRAEAQAVFDAIGQRTIWVSDQPGASSRLKLASNAFVFALTHGSAESLAIAKALGVDPALVLEAVTGGPLDSGYFQAKAAAMLKGDFAANFSVDNAIKDTRLVEDALLDTGVRADLVAAGLARFRRAADAGHGQDDSAASFLA